MSRDDFIRRAQRYRDAERAASDLADPFTLCVNSGPGSGVRVPVDTGDLGVQRGVDENAPLIRAIQDYDAGRPVDVVDVPLAVHRLPANARALRSVAERVRLAMGLQVAMGETEPLDLSASLVAWLMGWDQIRDKRRGSHARKKLVDYRVLRCVGSRPPRGMPDGTKRYEPADFDLASLLDVAEFAIESGVGVAQPGGAGVQRGAVPVEVVAQPLREAEGQAVVDWAVPRDHHYLGMVTARDAAGSHVTDGNPGGGGSGGAP